MITPQSSTMCFSFPFGTATDKKCCTEVLDLKQALHNTQKWHQVSPCWHELFQLNDISSTKSICSIKELKMGEGVCGWHCTG